jgi:membrane protease subunit HflC
MVVASERGIGPLLITREGEQKLILRFGDPRDKATSPGVSWRIPLIDDVRTFERRQLYLNMEPLPIQTRDEERIVVDNYIVWRIEDPLVFYASFPTGTDQANFQIDRVVRADVREVIGQHTLSDIVTVRAERQRLARKYRAEGDEQARTIRAEADRGARVIVAEARRDAEVARGKGDAEAARIYADAFETDPEFYGFRRNLEAYRKTIGAGTTLVLPPSHEFFRLFETSAPRPGAPAPGAGGSRGSRGGPAEGPPALP